MYFCATNIINYLDIPDIWDKETYNNKKFYDELNNLKKINVKINQIIYFYDFLGDDINDKYFQEVKNSIEKKYLISPKKSTCLSPVSNIFKNKLSSGFELNPND